MQQRREAAQAEHHEGERPQQRQQPQAQRPTRVDGPVVVELLALAAAQRRFLGTVSRQR